MFRHLIAGLLPLAAAAVAAANTMAGDFSWERVANKSVALKKGDQLLWRFHYGAGEPMPFFDPVALPDGPSITWDRPPDHPWHHGLWFSWKYINGAEYWAPHRGTGKPDGLTEWSNVRIAAHDDRSAQITMDLLYHPAGGEPVLTEKRAITVSSPAADGSYHFDWTSTFTAGKTDVVFDRTPLPGQPGGKAYGGYAGLSLRLAKELTDRAADSTKGPVVFNQQSRFRGRALALDYHGRIGQRELGVAVCDHPDNLNHPTPWYVIRTKTMSYFSPAVICYGPYTLKAGQSFTLRYRVILHPGRWRAEQLHEQYRRFVDQ